MSLPEFFKLHIVNNTGVTIEFSTDDANNSFVITAAPWKRNSSGALVFGDEVTLFADPTADLTDGASLEASAEFDNSSALWEGMNCRAHFETDAATAGTVDVFWEYSTDGSVAGTYPSDAADASVEEDCDFVVSVLSASAGTGEDRDANFQLGGGP